MENNVSRVHIGMFSNKEVDPNEIEFSLAGDERCMVYEYPSSYDDLVLFCEDILTRACELWGQGLVCVPEFAVNPIHIEDLRKAATEAITKNQNLTKIREIYGNEAKQTIPDYSPGNVENN